MHVYALYYSQMQNTYASSVVVHPVTTTYQEDIEINNVLCTVIMYGCNGHTFQLMFIAGHRQSDYGAVYMYVYQLLNMDSISDSYKWYSPD